MINQVVPNSAPKRAFRDFSQPQNGWYLAANHHEEEKKRSTKYGKTVAVGALVAGFGTLAIVKGAFPKTASKYLEKLRFKLEQRIAKGGRFNNFYRYSLNKINSFLDKSASINNITSLKDILFQRFMFGKDGQRTFTRRIHQGITDFFTNISRKTVNRSYAKTHGKFAGLNEYMMHLNDKILRRNHNKPEIQASIDLINSKMRHVNETLQNGFGINARHERLTEMNDATKELFDYMWNASFSDIKNFQSKNMYQSFIAEDYIVPYKMAMAAKVGRLRRVITNNIDDNYKSTMKVVDNIQKFVKPNDMATNETLGTIRANLIKYRKLSGKNEAIQRTELNSEIIANLKQLAKDFRTEEVEQGYSADAVSAISKYIEEVQSIISNSSKGELQEILTEYKKILPRSEYLKLRHKVNSAIKALDKSIDTETVKFFDKVRDLKLGSAPTDVLSILFTTGAVGWFLGKSKDKDERISASLKYGIPAIGAIATSLWCTARLVSGGKAMAFGLVSGWLMNKLGVVVDETRKNYKLDVSIENMKSAKIATKV